MAVVRARPRVRWLVLHQFLDGMCSLIDVIHIIRIELFTSSLYREPVEEGYEQVSAPARQGGGVVFRPMELYVIIDFLLKLQLIFYLHLVDGGLPPIRPT